MEGLTTNNHSMGEERGRVEVGGIKEVDPGRRGTEAFNNNSSKYAGPRQSGNHISNAGSLQQVCDYSRVPLTNLFNNTFLMTPEMRLTGSCFCCVPMCFF